MTRLYYTLLLLLAAATTFGQERSVQVSIDSTKIRIGSQFHLTVKATANKGEKVSFPEGKNFGQLEVLETFPTDTIEKDAMYELVKKYGLTQFDSGRYEIPKLPVIINNKTFQTKPLTIEVNNIVVDTIKQKMYDIKPVMGATSRSWLWLYIVLGLLFWGGVGYFIYRYIQKRKLEPKEIPADQTTPIERARLSFTKLEREGIAHKGEVKEYYSVLVNIARTYLEETLHIPAMESTTSQLIAALHDAVNRKHMSLDETVYEELEKVLRNADMAKFALSRPSDNVILQDRERIENAITTVDKNLPEEIEEVEPTEEEAARLLELQQKKKKRQRTIIIAASCFLLVLGTGAYIGITQGFDYLKDNILGHPTKELLEGEWVKSEYGVPGVTIETPKVLKRTDIRKYVTKEAAQNISEMQMFQYGSLFDNFHIAVATTVFKQKVEINLEAAFDATEKTWETQGASTILVKMEGFKTEHGTEGLRSYGTMFLPDPITKERKKVYYEIMYFKQDQGVQQVVILHEDGDRYAKKITERIKGSIEFKEKKKK
ncbi:BatD family protein [Flavobacterium sp. DGU11]|uniref:BatD family protein n=1 Tax=Flavobacterium arundinis TaxID=3139143 RepID=A0ABU9HY93_9FLAO